MQLPVMPPVEPMLAKPAKALPESAYGYEPKWDGFRAVIFRDGAEGLVTSRNQRPLLRYFPELVEPIVTMLPERCVVDGEIVVPGAVGLDFDALQQRVHPAESRVEKLSHETPAEFVAFDLLALGGDDLRGRPYGERRALLESALEGCEPPVIVTAATLGHDVASEWFTRFEGAGLDGVIAKPLDSAYSGGERGWLKLKHSHTADCVLGGMRLDDGGAVRSLLLGLYDDAGDLSYVGAAASFTATRRTELAELLEPLRCRADEEHSWLGEQRHGSTARRPDTKNRWSAQKDRGFVALRPELVAEVEYDQLESGRFRHVPKLVGWRTDRDPESCTFAQLDAVPADELRRFLRRGAAPD